MNAELSVLSDVLVRLCNALHRNIDKSWSSIEQELAVTMYNAAINLSELLQDSPHPDDLDNWAIWLNHIRYPLNSMDVAAVMLLSEYFRERSDTHRKVIVKSIRETISQVRDGIDEAASQLELVA
jgi:hypothetical protein